MLVPPSPVPVGSPVCITKPGATRWKMVPLYVPSRQCCRKLRVVSGVCCAKRDRVNGPAVVRRRTVAVGGGSVVYWLDMIDWSSLPGLEDVPRKADYVALSLIITVKLVKIYLSVAYSYIEWKKYSSSGGQRKDSHCIWPWWANPVYGA